MVEPISSLFMGEGGPSPSTDAAILAAARDIFITFLGCPLQKMAYEAIINDVLNCDFSWETSVGGKLYGESIPVDSYQYAMWNEFVRDILLQTAMYGFFVYRLK